MSTHTVLIECENYGSFECACKESESKSPLLNWLKAHVGKTCMYKRMFIQFLKYMLRLLFFLFMFGMSAMLGKIVTMMYVVPRVDVSIPPAPDILLDSFQHSLPQAFKASEAITFMFVSMLVVISLLHTKERSFIMPRYLFISSTLINLRTLCISITTFSIPSRELSEKCLNLQKLSTEMLWWKSINFMEFSETCGDYVFSGHATAMVISSWFVWYYGRSLSFISCNTFKKVMNFILCCVTFIGLMCILFAKEHYTVDMALGTVISIMWCSLYHSLLENHRNQVKTHVVDNMQESAQLGDNVEKYEICNISSIIYWWFTIFDSTGLERMNILIQFRRFEAIE